MAIRKFGPQAKALNIASKLVLPEQDLGNARIFARRQIRVHVGHIVDPARIDQIEPILERRQSGGSRTLQHEKMVVVDHVHGGDARQRFATEHANEVMRRIHPIRQLFRVPFAGFFGRLKRDACQPHDRAILRRGPRPVGRKGLLIGRPEVATIRFNGE